MIGIERQRPAPWPGFRSGFLVLAFFVALDLLFLFMLPSEARELRPESLIVLGVLGMWRWAWNAVHIVRSFIFAHVAFPRMRARAEAIPAERRYPDRVYFLVPTYREQPWISRRVLTAIVREAGTVPCPITVIVSSGSEAEEAVFLRGLRDNPDRDRVDIVLMRQRHGKRTALGHALRSISRRRGEEKSLAIFMDGDTVLGPDVLRKCLPIFALSPRIGAVTTDEISIVQGSRWYRNWYALRFAQRHRLMKSLSLSRRVLTLTGRFSIVRAEIATSEEFLSYLEDDALDHWLYGRFKFLTGDDKSTWFCLLRQGWEMHYVPDAIVYSLESSGDKPLKTAFAKMHRWFGNMLRNNGRAIALGPRRMGLFTWWCLVDQRISIWTALAGPVGAILMSLFLSPWFVCLYLFVAILVRLVYLMVLSLEGLRLSVQHLPQLFFTQWVGAMVKIHVQFRLNRINVA